VGIGPDGTAWFTESNGRRSYIGHIAADGSIVTFRVPWKGYEMFSIVEGPDHAMWFSDSTRRIGRITLDGHITAKARTRARRGARVERPDHVVHGG
jgi:virginiamycin B lyase